MNWNMTNSTTNAASNQQLEPCPLTIHENVEGTWDILVDGELTNPRMTLWTEAGANEVVRRIHAAYSHSRISDGGVVATDGPLVAMTHPDWVALCHALEATLDISPKDLTLKAQRLVESKTKYAREVIKLEGQLLEKCPELDK